MTSVLNMQARKKIASVKSSVKNINVENLAPIFYLLNYQYDLSI